MSEPTRQAPLDWAWKAAEEFLNEVTDGDMSMQDTLAAIITRHAEPNERLRKAAEMALDLLSDYTLPDGSPDPDSEEVMDALRAALSTPPQKEEEKTWRCFHCDVVFNDRLKAKQHFGDLSFKDGAAAWDIPACASNPLSESEVSK